MIIGNGRNLSAPLTGIQRYTLEMIKRMPEIRVVASTSHAQGISGHAWEQTILPFKVGKHVLWSPSNTGPLAVRRQVVTVHDLATLECPEGFSPAFRHFYNWLLPQLLPRVSAIVAISEFTKSRIVERFGIASEKIHVIPQAIDHKTFYPRNSNEIQQLRLKLVLPKRYILFLGALSARKNVAKLIAAWKIAQTTIDTDVELVIAGGAGASHVFDGTQLPLLPPRTHSLGRIDGDDLPALLSGADLFAFPSLYEGFGLPPLEAMACGTACMISDSTSLPEVGGDAVKYVTPTDVESIAAGLTELLNSPSLLEQYAQKGIKRAQQFNWDTTAAATKQLLGAC